MKIDSHLNAYTDLVNRRLDELIPETNSPQATLYRAARYSLLGEGKRMRPRLTLLTAQCAGGSTELALDPACAIELIHTYSLIHDDLPCMDNDDFRRGKPSLHKAFSEGMAVLAGDYLLTRAFEIIANCKGLTETQVAKLVRVLSQKAGGGGMIGGQVMDINLEAGSASLAQIEQIHLLKTGALIQAAIDFGAIIAEVDEKSYTLLHKFATSIGLCFQVMDDILDVTSPQKNIGKEIASDEANNKATYATLLGIQRAKALAEQLAGEAVSFLEQLPFDTTPLQEIPAFITERSY